MIDGLIGGRLHGKPTKRSSSNGNSFVVAKVRAAAGDGESLFVSVIAWDADVGAALLSLDAGDSVSLAGQLTPKVWAPPSGAPRPSLDMTAHAILTTYHVQRKRRTVEKANPVQGELIRRVSSDDGLDDDLPWSEGE